MLTKLKAASLKAKNEIKTHRGKIVFITCASLHVLIMTKYTERIDEFLTEEGIDPMKFWLCPEDYEADFG